MAGIDTILKAADLISEIRRAFIKIENLESGQKHLADALTALDKRVRELEAGLREAKADIKFEAIKEAQMIVNSVQWQLYQRLNEVSIGLDRLDRSTLQDQGSNRALRAPDKV